MSSEARRRQDSTRIPVFFFLLAVVLGGCGKKGDPAPPLRAVPAPTRDLAVLQRDGFLHLTLTYPTLTPAGAPLGGVTAVEVWEVARPAPPPPAPPAAAPTAPSEAETAEAKPAEEPAAPAPPAPAPAVEAAARLAPLDPRQFTAAATERLRLEGEAVAAATAGDRLILELPLPDPLPEPPEARWYAVRTVGPAGDRSELSNQVGLVLTRPPAPPAATTVTAMAEGVRIEWQEPPGGVQGLAGFNVYRRGAQTRSYGEPLHAAGPADRHFVDTTARYGESYIYAVTAVTRRRPTVESAFQSEHEVRYQDRFPPPPPAEPVALAEVQPGGSRVRVVWRGSEAPDLAGYLVYRRRGQREEFERLTPEPIGALEFVDEGLPQGVYTYRVTAVDALGNESEPAAARVAIE